MGSIPPPYNSYEPSGVYLNGAQQSSSRRFVDSAMDGEYAAPAPSSMNDSNFDILEWHPAYLSCQRYFIDHAQYEPGTQAVCALINIRLPFQWLANPITQSSPPHASQGPAGGQSFNFNAYSRQNNYSPHGRNHNDQPPNFVSPIPYIRRLVVTGFDKPAILHGFFGDDFNKGMMPHVECERRNYLFAAKHGGWRSCKKQYDSGSGGGGDEGVPFMKPLDGAKLEELTAAEKAWSSWLAMEDWMVGPRAPENEDARRTHSHRTSGSGSMRYTGASYAGTGSGGHQYGGMPDGRPDGMPDGVGHNSRLPDGV